MATETRYAHTKDEQRIRAAISRMPYGALERIEKHAREVGITKSHKIGTHPMVPITLDAVASYLEALVEVLVETSKEATEIEKKARNLEIERATVRRYLGLALSESSGGEVREILRKEEPES